MRVTRRWTAVLMLLLATAVAGQPILHNHPLIPGPGPEQPSLSSAQGLSCAICAVSKGQTTVEPPVVNAAVQVVRELAVAPAVIPSSAVRSTLSSRAPPMA